MAYWKGMALVAVLAVLGCKDGASGDEFNFSGTADDGADTMGTAASQGTSVLPTGTGGPSDDDSNGGTATPIFDVGGMNDPPPQGDGCTKVDFLFVIDTSGSMTQEQEALRTAYPGFIQGIEAAGILDYHVAVTTADMGSCGIGGGGDNGAFQWQPAIMNPECYPLPLRYIDGPSGESTLEFQCIAEIFGGSGTEQPFQAGYAALVDRLQDGTNPVEFRRSDALLVVMYITDEDDQSRLSGGVDCTVEPITLYTSLYEQAVLKGNLTAGVFIAISGPPTASCSSPGLGNASAAPRVDEFVTHWGPRGFWANICNGDFPAALEGALATIEFGCDEFDPEG